MLTDEELLRYSRHVLLKQIDIEGQQRLKNSRILIVGAGGLGTPVALYLAAAGIGNLCIADFDKVDLTNLQRQVLYSTEDIGRSKVCAARQRMLQLNPNINVCAVEQAITDENLPSLLAEVDLVMDCTDNFIIRDLLNRHCFSAKKVLVSGAAIRTMGQVSVFDPNNEQSPCYHCLYGSGQDESLTCSEAGVLGPLVGLVGSIQALEALKIVANFGRPLIGRLLLIDALDSRMRELKITRDEQCSVCQQRN